VDWLEDGHCLYENEPLYQIYHQGAIVRDVISQNASSDDENGQKLLVDNLDHMENNCQPFDAHCCHVGTAIKHPVPDRVKPSFVIFDIRAL